MSLPTLFLDFDGVLHPNYCSPPEYFSRLPDLEDVLAGIDIQIVISSSWRFHFSKGRITKTFPESLRNRVIGITGDAQPGKYARWNEIRTYAETHGVSNWRALDDSAFEFPARCKELIRCDSRVGVQTRQLEIIRVWAQGSK